MANGLQRCIDNLRRDVSIKFGESAASVILYGSAVYESKNNNDVDICVVLNDSSIHISEVRSVLNKHVKNVDVSLYHRNELMNPFFFQDINSGAFAAEYLAAGISVVGENPFVELLSRLSPSAYRYSLKQKMFDYILRVRRVYLNSKRRQADLVFIKKYIRRILIDLLLFKRVESFQAMDRMDMNSIIALARKHNAISEAAFPSSLPKQSKELFEVFFNANEYLAKVIYELPDEKFAVK